MHTGKEARGTTAQGRRRLAMLATLTAARGSTSLHARCRNGCDLAFKLVKIKLKKHTCTREACAEISKHEGIESKASGSVELDIGPALQKPVGEQTSLLLNTPKKGRTLKLLGTKS